MCVCVCVSFSEVSSVDDKGASGSAKKKDSGADFDPSKDSYHPVDDACWKRGEK